MLAENLALLGLLGTATRPIDTYTNIISGQKKIIKKIIGSLGLQVSSKKIKTPLHTV